mgnify:CR=1 FL=1
MRHSTGGYRAAEFETVAAADAGAGYIGKKLYAVTGMPGVWRRVKEPKGNPTESGVLPCWFDGGVIFLEHCESVNEELEHARPQLPNEAEVLEFLKTLGENRGTARVREAEAAKPKAADPAQNSQTQTAEAVATTHNTAEGDKSGSGASDGPKPDDLDV